MGRLHSSSVALLPAIPALPVCMYQHSACKACFRSHAVRNLNACAHRQTPLPRAGLPEPVPALAALLHRSNGRIVFIMLVVITGIFIVIIAILKIIIILIIIIVTTNPDARIHHRVRVRGGGE